MAINIVATKGLNGEFGKKNTFLWYDKEILNDIERLTRCKDVMITYDLLSLYAKYYPKMVERRRIFTMGKNNLDQFLNVNNYEDITPLLEKYRKKLNLYVMGGIEVYEAFMPYADNLFLNEIEAYEDSANEFFPYFEEDRYVKKLVKTGNTFGTNYKQNIYGRKDK